MPEVFNTLSMDQIETLLDENGIVTKRELADDLSFLRFNSGPFTVLLVPYGPEPDHHSLQFRAGFRAKATLETINAWNMANRFGKAYVDDEGDPVLEYDLDLEGGAVERTVMEAVKTFRTLVHDFSNVIMED